MEKYFTHFIPPPHEKKNKQRSKQLKYAAFETKALFQSFDVKNSSVVGSLSAMILT